MLPEKSKYHEYQTKPLLSNLLKNGLWRLNSKVVKRAFGLVVLILLKVQELKSSILTIPQKS